MEQVYVDCSLERRRFAGEETPSGSVRRMITYLGNDAERMKCAEYRTAGFPITTLPVELVLKYVNKRIKGTEISNERNRLILA